MSSVAWSISPLSWPGIARRKTLVDALMSRPPRYLAPCLEFRSPGQARRRRSGNRFKSLLQGANCPLMPQSRLLLCSCLLQRRLLLHRCLLQCCFGLGRARVERHVQGQSLLAGCAFGPLELAGDLGGRRLCLRKLLEVADIFRSPLPPFRLLDQHSLLEVRAGATGAGQAISNRHLLLKSRSKVKMIIFGTFGSTQPLRQAACAARRIPVMARR